MPGFLAAKPVSFFYRKKTLFMIMERGNDARDNGFCFFEYVREKHPEIEAYYAITKDSPDRGKLSKYGRNVVDFKSFRHYLTYCRATHVISTHTRGYNKYVKMFRLNGNQKHIFLQHGVTMSYIPDFQYSNTRLDLVICGAQPEYEFMKSVYGYPEGTVKYTGFCRFDKLHDFTVKRQILVMPTWRKWLSGENFINSGYLKSYNALLSDRRLADILKQYGIELIFYPHHEVQPYISLFDSNNGDNIIIASKYEYDVQELLKESSLLVTDYSSVFFDFGYMHKPVIYYQFDREEFRRSHYQKGYFSYDDGFGPVAFDNDALIDYIGEYCRNGFQMDRKYLKKVDEYFVLCDTDNCKRVFDSVIGQ